MLKLLTLTSIIALAALMPAAASAHSHDDAHANHGKMATVRDGGSRVDPDAANVKIGGAFDMLDHTGKAVTNETFAGKPMLVFFGFTHCPDVCPTGLQNMTDALHLAGMNTAAKITPVFVTVDAARDTPEVMAKYVSHFTPGLVGLTGTEAQIAAMAKAYKVYYAKVGDKDNPDYMMDHSAFFYLMGPTGQFLKAIPADSDPQDIAMALREATR